jgi:hypothetical protein
VEIAAYARQGERAASFAMACNLLSRYVHQNGATAAELGLGISKGEWSGDSGVELGVVVLFSLLNGGRFPCVESSKLNARALLRLKIVFSKCKHNIRNFFTCIAKCPSSAADKLKLYVPTVPKKKHDFYHRNMVVFILILVVEN